jgi:hypothetical protein
MANKSLPQTADRAFRFAFPPPLQAGPGAEQAT